MSLLTHLVKHLSTRGATIKHGQYWFYRIQDLGCFTITVYNDFRSLIIAIIQFHQHSSNANTNRVRHHTIPCLCLWKLLYWWFILSWLHWPQSWLSCYLSVKGWPSFMNIYCLDNAIWTVFNGHLNSEKELQFQVYWYLSRINQLWDGMHFAFFWCFFFPKFEKRNVNLQNSVKKSK